MATVNDIVLQVADNTDKSFDVMFKERIKDLVLIGISKYIKQSIDNNGISDEFISTQEVELIHVNELEVCDGANQGCVILRSKNKVLKPISNTGSEPFINVSTYNGVIVAMQTTLSGKKNQKFARYTHSVIMYEYRQGYIFLYNNNALTHLFIQGIYTTTLPLSGTECDKPNCFTLDTEIPLNGNYIDAIKTDIYTELGLTVPTPNVEVPITKPTKQP